MKRAKKFVLVLGILVALAIILCPSWRYGGPNGITVSIGRAFLWSPSSQLLGCVHVDRSRVGAELAIIAIVTAGLVHAFRDRKPASPFI